MASYGAHFASHYHAKYLHPVKTGVHMTTTEDGCPAKPDFSYRRNADGSLDSICMHCYLTVCSCFGESPDSCAPREQQHKCNHEEVTRLRVEPCCSSC